jgi:hypothetical protein
VIDSRTVLNGALGSLGDGRGVVVSGTRKAYATLHPDHQDAVYGVRRLGENRHPRAEDIVIVASEISFGEEVEVAGREAGPD